MLFFFFFHLHFLSSVQWCASQSWRWKREKVATQQPKTPRCANSAQLTGKGWKEIRKRSQSQSPWKRPLPTRTTVRDVSNVSSWAIASHWWEQSHPASKAWGGERKSDLWIMAQGPVGDCSEKEPALWPLVRWWLLAAARDLASMGFFSRTWSPFAKKH